MLQQTNAAPASGPPSESESLLYPWPRYPPWCLLLLFLPNHLILLWPFKIINQGVKPTLLVEVASLLRLVVRMILRRVCHFRVVYASTRPRAPPSASPWPLWAARWAALPRGCAICFRPFTCEARLVTTMFMTRRSLGGVGIPRSSASELRC